VYFKQANSQWGLPAYVITDKKESRNFGVSFHSTPQGILYSRI